MNNTTSNCKVDRSAREEGAQAYTSQASRSSNESIRIFRPSLLGRLARVMVRTLAVAGLAACAVVTPSKASTRLQSNISLGYKASSDFAAQERPRLTTHAISSDFAIVAKDHHQQENLFYLAMSLGGRFKTLGSTVTANADGEAFNYSDVDLYAGKDFQFGSHAYPQNLGLAGGTMLPTSPESQAEAVRAIPYGTVKLNSSFADGCLVIGNLVNANYIANTYRFSPNTLDINSDGSVSWTLSGTLKFLKYFSVAVGGSIKNSHYIDDTNLSSFNNFQSLSAHWKQWSVSLRHTNGNHLTDQDYALWYIDQYRRIVSFNLGATF